MTIDKELAKAIVFDDYLSDGVEVVERGEWVNEGKYEYSSYVFSKDGAFYELGMGRSGSYHTDWYYDFEDMDSFECSKVEKVEVTTYKWVGVKEEA